MACGTQTGLAVGDAATRYVRTEAESLTPFPFWVPVDGVTMTDVSASDFAVVVYREDDVWEAEVLPTALTENLDGLIHGIAPAAGHWRNNWPGGRWR